MLSPLAFLRQTYRDLRRRQKHGRGGRKATDRLYHLPERAADERADKGLVVVSIFRDEGPYLHEWIEFHRMVGVDHFCLYDNGSTDGGPASLAPYVETGIVTLTPWRTFSGFADMQKLANAHAIANHCGRYRWAAFFDLDEFLFSPTHETVPDALDRLGDQPIVSIPWFNFGPNGHRDRPNGLTIENYTERGVFPPTMQQRSLMRYKTVADPTRLVVSGTHHLQVRDQEPTTMFNERGKRMSTVEAERRENAVSEHLRLHHYFTRSRSEMEAKVARGRQHVARQPVKSMDSRLGQYELATERDETMLRFVPELKRRLADPPGL